MMETHTSYVDTLLREYLLYRGFTNALVTFNADARNDRDFDRVDRVVELIFHKHLPQLDVQGLMSTLALLRHRFFSRLDASFAPAVARLETSITRLLVVAAVQQGKKEKISELFEKEGERLSAMSDEWHAWFAVLYVKKPHKDPRFAPYFAAGWADAVVVSAHNFLSEVMHGAPLPAVLKFGEERRRRTAAENDARALELEVGRLRHLLEARERELAEMGGKHAAAQQEAREAKAEARAEAAKAAKAEERATEAIASAAAASAAAASAAAASARATASSGAAAAASSSSGGSVRSPRGGGAPSPSTPTGLLHRQLSRSGSNGGGDDAAVAGEGTTTSDGEGSSSSGRGGDGEEASAAAAAAAGDDEEGNITASTARIHRLSSHSDSTPAEGRRGAGGSAAATDDDEDANEGGDSGSGSGSGNGNGRGGGGGGSDAMTVDILRRDAFAWHTAGITQCRFSADGANVASGSADGTVRVWSPDPSGAASVGWGG